MSLNNLKFTVRDFATPDNEKRSKSLCYKGSRPCLVAEAGLEHATSRL